MAHCDRLNSVLFTFVLMNIKSNKRKKQYVTRPKHWYQGDYHVKSAI